MQRWYGKLRAWAYARMPSQRTGPLSVIKFSAKLAVKKKKNIHKKQNGIMGT